MPDLGSIARKADLASIARKTGLASIARNSRLRRLVGPAAVLFAFVLFVVLSFPYDTLARRLEVEARSAGADLTIGSLGPGGLASVRARNVRLRLPSPPGADAQPELRFERADFSPDLLPLLLRRTAFGFALRGYGGSARGHATLSKDPRVPGLSSIRLDARDLDLQELPLRDMAGIEAAGKLQLKVDLSSLQPIETAGGNVQLTVDGATVNGGTLSGPMGPMPVPQLSLGHVDAALTVEKGVARVERMTARGGDVEADVDGTLQLRPLLSLSQADLHVQFRPADRWLDANPTYKGALSLIQNARQSDGAYAYSIGGPLARAIPRPGR